MRSIAVVDSVIRIVSSVLFAVGTVGWHSATICVASATVASSARTATITAVAARTCIALTTSAARRTVAIATIDVNILWSHLLSLRIHSVIVLPHLHVSLCLIDLVAVVAAEHVINSICEEGEEE